jgi:glyceraldehyde 3-phosphate dehydrogenase
VEASKEVTLEEVQDVFRKAADTGGLAGIMRYSEEPLVSSDIVGDPYSSIIDGGLIRVLGNQVKMSSWYDNEWGYSNRLVDLSAYMAKSL